MGRKSREIGGGGMTAPLVVFFVLALAVAAMLAGMRWVRLLKADFWRPSFEDYELRERMAYEAERSI